MKVLFLDVNGVLNTNPMFTPKSGTFVLCDERIAKLNDLLEKTGAKVVLSSSWRKSKEHVAYLEEHGALKHKHDDWRTGEAPIRDLETGVWLSFHRGREVDEWLDRHPEVTDYAIIDDMTGFLPKQRQFFVETNPGYGLRDKHVRKLMAILGLKKNDEPA